MKCQGTLAVNMAIVEAMVAKAVNEMMVDATGSAIGIGIATMIDLVIIDGTIETDGIVMTTIAKETIGGLTIEEEMIVVTEMIAGRMTGDVTGTVDHQQKMLSNLRDFEFAHFSCTATVGVLP